MKTIILVSALAVAVVPIQAAMAQEGVSFGLKAGMLSIENDSDSAANVGALVSMAFPASPFGVEGEVNTSVSDGSFNRFVDYSATQVGAFGTFRFPPQDVNVKLRLGGMYTSVDPSPGKRDHDTDLAYGIGGNVGPFELSWTRTRFNSSDVDFLAIGYNF